MAQPKVVLMSAGHRFTESGEGIATGTRVYFDAAARPDLASVDLPVMGEAWDAVYTGLYCINIDKTPIGEDTSAGYQYVCSYSSYSVPGDILSSDRVVPEISVTVSTDAAFDSYTHNPEKDEAIYSSPTGSVWTKIADDISVNRLTPTAHVSITERYTGTIGDLLASNVGLVGRLNVAAMWGHGIGTILFNGVTASPVKTLVEGVTKIGWNRTYSYSIRYLEGITAHTWQYIFVKGKYVQLSTTASTTGMAAVRPYEYATLPNPLA